MACTNRQRAAVRSSTQAFVAAAVLAWVGCGGTASNDTPHPCAPLAPGNALFVEYNATTTDAHRLVVMRPTEGWTSSDVRVFYGTDTNMLERPLLSFDRGGFTGIAFTVDGQEYGATFADGDKGVPDIKTNLVEGGPPDFSGHASHVLNLQDTAAASSLKYVCTR